MFVCRGSFSVPIRTFCLACHANTNYGQVVKISKAQYVAKRSCCSSEHPSRPPPSEGGLCTHRWPFSTPFLPAAATNAPFQNSHLSRPKEAPAKSGPGLLISTPSGQICTGAWISCTKRAWPEHRIDLVVLHVVFQGVFHRSRFLNGINTACSHFNSTRQCPLICMYL